MKAPKIPKRILFLAENMARGFDRSPVWPEDHWVSLARDWDLNVWAEEDTGAHVADIFWVRDGQTQTDRWFRCYCNTELHQDSFALEVEDGKN